MNLYASGWMWRARKLLRFAAIYGLRRSIVKAAGRLRIAIPFPLLRHRASDIGVVGCGQFAFATLGYFLSKKFGRRIATCYDTDFRARDTFARAFGVPHVADSFSALIAQQQLRTIYIASNHASHCDYATEALRRGLNVYIEKPIVVSYEQLKTLTSVIRKVKGNVYAGYNRPFAAALRLLSREMVINASAGMSVQCFVAGHKIAADHWYRQPEEGTRVAGNLGHWLDLLVHVLAWRGLPDRLDISIAYADVADKDDNVCISIASDRGDLLSVMLTSRCEPFEGINETINIQHGETICKIDDFRRLTIWRGPRLVRRTFWPKDVGHEMAILQPFSREGGRDWHEVELSTLLMLHVIDMVRAGVRQSTFSFGDSWSRLVREVESL